MSLSLAQSGQMISSPSVMKPLPAMESWHIAHIKHWECQWRPSNEIKRVPPAPVMGLLQAVHRLANSSPKQLALEEKNNWVKFNWSNFVKNPWKSLILKKIRCFNPNCHLNDIITSKVCLASTQISDRPVSSGSLYIRSIPYAKPVGKNINNNNFKQKIRYTFDA